MTSPCQKNVELAMNVQRVLDHIVELTTAQLAAFRSGNNAEMMRIDKSLENAMGEKERTIGAYNEHRKEHGC